MLGKWIYFSIYLKSISIINITGKNFLVETEDVKKEARDDVRKGKFGNFSIYIFIFYEIILMVMRKLL